jgi:hypothetical protein
MKKTGIKETEAKFVTKNLTDEDRKEIAETEALEKNRKSSDILKNLKFINKPVTEWDENENYDILKTENISDIKVVLRIAVLRKGFKNVDDYVKQSKLDYSLSTLRLAFSKNQKTTDKILLEIAKELDVELEIEEKKIYKIKQ